MFIVFVRNHSKWKESAAQYAPTNSGQEGANSKSFKRISMASYNAEDRHQSNLGACCAAVLVERKPQPET